MVDLRSSLIPWRFLSVPLPSGIGRPCLYPEGVRQHSRGSRTRAPPERGLHHLASTPKGLHSARGTPCRTPLGFREKSVVPCSGGARVRDPRLCCATPSG